MSRQIEFVRANTLAGFTGKRGNPWWYREGTDIASNLYTGAIPLAAVENKLFNFDVIESPVFVQFNGEFIQVPNRKGMVHSGNGTAMGIHSDGYNGHGYRPWLLENVYTMLGNETALANAGLLNNYAVAYVQVEMPDNIRVGGMDVRPFILATTSFDGSIATTYKTGFTNVVCDNTYGMFMRERAEVYRVKHTRNSQFNVTDAAAALGILHNVAEETTNSIERLLSVDVSDAQWSKFVQAHVPTTDEKGADLSKRSISMAETKRQALTGLYRTDVRVAPWAGTAWGVVQAVNTYNQHLSIVRGADRLDRSMLRAVKGEIATADRAALDTLSAVMGRDLAAV